MKVTLTHPCLGGHGLRLGSLRSGRTVLRAVARRGSTIVGVNSQGRLLLIAPKVQRRGTSTRITRDWHLDAVRCCNDLGFIEEGTPKVEEIERFVEAEREQEDIRIEAKSAVRVLHKLNLPVPAELDAACLP